MHAPMHPRCHVHACAHQAAGDALNVLWPRVLDGRQRQRGGPHALLVLHAAAAPPPAPDVGQHELQRVRGRDGRFDGCNICRSHACMLRPIAFKATMQAGRYRGAGQAHRTRFPRVLCRAHGTARGPTPDVCMHGHTQHGASSPSPHPRVCVRARGRRTCTSVSALRSVDSISASLDGLGGVHMASTAPRAASMSTPAGAPLGSLFASLKYAATSPFGKSRPACVRTHSGAEWGDPSRAHACMHAAQRCGQSSSGSPAMAMMVACWLHLRRAWPGKTCGWVLRWHG